jgi:hypothetical protein
MRIKYPYTGPFDKETNVKANKKAIARAFNQVILLGSGTARLRKGSQTGEILEEFEVNSGKVSANGRELVLYPEKVLPYETEIFLTMDDGLVIAKKTGQKCDFLNETSEKTFSFTTENAIGKPLDGGIVLSKTGGRYLIVSPQKAEIKLFWEEREKAILNTQEITGTSGWFVPSSGLLINKDLNVRNLWFKGENGNNYWTNDGYEIDMNDLILRSINKNTMNKVRTFKFAEV